MIPRALLLAILLASAPLAGAAWRGAGGLEPDTERDRQDGLMFPDPDALAGTDLRQVHFQAFVAVPETSLNPNLAIVGSRVLPAPALHHRALLGVWKDCNEDGYIGSAESATMDYPAALLFGSDVCPAANDPSVPAHNVAGWVSELLSIGMVDPCEYALEAATREACGVDAFARNERVLYVNETYVWGDLGLPGSIPATECVLAPLPGGTTTGSGAIVAWADCQSRRGIARQVNEIDALLGGVGLGFEDPARPEDSDSLLNQRFPVTPFGRGDEPGLLQDDTDEASATAWDCEAAPIAEANDPQGRREIAIEDPTGALHAERFPQVIAHSLTGVGFEDHDHDPSTPGVYRRALTDDDGTYARVPTPDGSVEGPTASWWRAAADASDGVAGDCDASSPSALDAAYPFRAVEGDASPILEARKDRTSVTFTFFDGHRGIHPSLDPTTGPVTPSDGGTLWLDHGHGGDGPMWSATAQSDQDPVLLDRDDLGPSAAVYYTYYAHLGPLAMAYALPSDEARTYGEENCGLHQDGVHLGWVCDPALWWRDVDGADNAPRYAQGLRIGRVPGDAYHLRDVDCYDGELARGTGVYASLADLVTGGPCR